MFRIIQPNTWYADPHGAPAKSSALPTKSSTTSATVARASPAWAAFNTNLNR